MPLYHHIWTLDDIFSFTRFFFYHATHKKTGVKGVCTGENLYLSSGFRDGGGGVVDDGLRLQTSSPACTGASCRTAFTAGISCRTVCTSLAPPPRACAPLCRCTCFSRTPHHTHACTCTTCATGCTTHAAPVNGYSSCLVVTITSLSACCTHTSTRGGLSTRLKPAHDSGRTRTSKALYHLTWTTSTTIFHRGACARSVT